MLHFKILTPQKSWVKELTATHMLAFCAKKSCNLHVQWHHCVMQGRNVIIPEDDVEMLWCASNAACLRVRQGTFILKSIRVYKQPWQKMTRNYPFLTRRTRPRRRIYILEYTSKIGENHERSRPITYWNFCTSQLSAYLLNTRIFRTNCYLCTCVPVHVHFRFSCHSSITRLSACIQLVTLSTHFRHKPRCACKIWKGWHFCFLAHLIYQPKSLNNHALSLVCPVSSLSLLSVDSLPRFIFGMNMVMPLSYPALQTPA